MGCIHSTRIHSMKKHGADTDTGGVPKKAEPEVHPELLQLAELVKAESHAFTEKSFRKKRVCDVCRQHVENTGAFCKGESMSQSDSRTTHTSMLNEA
ncbi:hypothetical protein LDENG_00045750 [Lucifuga dentata]|nr:hypothetical protein LDENG_00045750 [Lucifuga dentata]